MKLVMLADDFTGALDTGVQLAKCGIKTIATGNLLRTQSGLPDDCEALIFNTNSRHDTPATAFDKTTELLKKWHSKAEYIFIKTDSALRGNLSATMGAAISSMQQPLMFVPSFPRVNRITKNGLHYIDSVLLQDSVFKNDPLNPMLQSEVACIVSKDYPIKTKLVQLSNLGDNHNGETCICIFDCTSQEELTQIASSLKDQNLLRLTAGCAGFASVLPEYIPFKITQNTQSSTGEKGLLIVSGSANNISAGQILAAESSGVPVLHISPEMVMGKNGEILEDDATKKIAKLLSEGKTVIAATVRNYTDAPKADAFALANGIAEPKMHDMIATRIASLTKKILDMQSCNLAVFGGDTTYAIMQKLGREDLTICSEIETGVPLSSLEYNGNTIALITKSGGLGSPNIILNTTEYLRRN